MPYRIPLGKMTTFAGSTGLGKTFALCDLAARVSTGGEVPFGGGAKFQQGKVLFISSEDDADDTLVPRLMELGADLSQVFFLSPESEDHFTLSALELLSGMLDDMGPGVRMVAIDPPTSYVGGVDDHKNSELRGLLGPLKRWCSDRRVALIFVTHVNKSAQSVDAMARVIGSVAWVAAVRAAHMFCPDPDNPDQTLFIPLKINIGPKMKGLAFRIVPTTNDQATLEWLGETSTTADEAMSSQRKEKKTRKASAIEFLEQQFRIQRVWESAEIKRLGKEEGISNNAIFEAKKELPIDARQVPTQDGERFWEWRARPGWPKS